MFEASSEVGGVLLLSVEHKQGGARRRNRATIITMLLLQERGIESEAYLTAVSHRDERLALYLFVKVTTVGRVRAVDSTPTMTSVHCYSVSMSLFTASVDVPLTTGENTRDLVSRYQEQFPEDQQETCLDLGASS